MKKWKLAVVVLCGLLMAAGTFNKVEMPVYAYTEDEIEAAKAWLSANGYSPTRSGAEAAYRDYLNGKWGPVGGEEEATTTPATEAPQTEAPADTPAVEAAASVEPLTIVEETTVIETTAGETTEEITVTEETETESTTVGETILESSSDMETESTSEVETSSEDLTEQSTEENEEAFVHVGRYDGIILVIAIAACAAMIFFTFRYIKKDKKDGE